MIHLVDNKNNKWALVFVLRVILAISLIRTQNAFLAESGFLPQLAANIVILQTNAQYIDIFSSFYTLVIQFVFTQAKA